MSEDLQVFSDIYRNTAIIQKVVTPESNLYVGTEKYRLVVFTSNGFVTHVSISDSKEIVMELLHRFSHGTFRQTIPSEGWLADFEIVRKVLDGVTYDLR